jgi:hypothetical protein
MTTAAEPKPRNDQMREYRERPADQERATDAEHVIAVTEAEGALRPYDWRRQVT